MLSSFLFDVFAHVYNDDDKNIYLFGIFRKS